MSVHHCARLHTSRTALRATAAIVALTLAAAATGCGDDGGGTNGGSSGKDFHDSGVLRASLFTQLSADYELQGIVCPKTIEGDEVICVATDLGGGGDGDTTLNVHIQDGGKSYVTTTQGQNFTVHDEIP